MLHKILTYLAKIDFISSNKENKITAGSVIQYNEPKGLSGLDLVYWDYIKDQLPGSGGMEYLGEIDPLPDPESDGEVVRIGNDYYISEDGEFRILVKDHYIEIEGNIFRFIPIPLTNRGDFEQGDIVANGWRSTTKFWKLAQYSGSGDPKLFASWNVIEEI